MECIVCECKQQSKYKCPTCLQPYCSVACYKKHSTPPCTAAPPAHAPASPPPVPRAAYDFPTEDTVPEQKLKLLEQSSGLRRCLENPHLRKLLETLDGCEHPDSLIKRYMQEPIFTEFVDECLQVVGGTGDAEPLLHLTTFMLTQ